MKRRLWQQGGLWVWTALTLGPVIWLLVNSFRSSLEIFNHPFGWPQQLLWQNYATAWTNSHFGSYALNSFWVTGWTTVLTTVGGSLLAYPLARMNFWGRGMVYFALALGISIPLQLLALPLFFELRALGLLNTTSGLILVYTATGLPFATLTLMSFFQAVPRDLYDSGRIDGASEFETFYLLILPLVRGGLVTSAIFTALSIYNEYFLAFLFLSGQGGQSSRTLPLGLANLSMTSQYRTDYGQLLAGAVLALVPLAIFYVVCAERLAAGLSEGAVKGE